MKLFQWVKEIRSKDGVLHFKRYAIVETNCFAIYIHKIYEADKDRHMHNHPWNFFGIVLNGSYTEQYEHHEEHVVDTVWNIFPLITTVSRSTKTRIKKLFSVSFGTRCYYHKILEINDGPITTLFLTFGKHRPWYYHIDDDILRFKNDADYVESSAYRKLKNEGKL